MATCDLTYKHQFKLYVAKAYLNAHLWVPTMYM